MSSRPWHILKQFPVAAAGPCPPIGERRPEVVQPPRRKYHTDPGRERHGDILPAVARSNAERHAGFRGEAPPRALNQVSGLLDD